MATESYIKRKKVCDERQNINNFPLSPSGDALPAVLRGFDGISDCSLVVTGQAVGIWRTIAVFVEVGTEFRH
jgi:hypothetical protein